MEAKFNEDDRRILADVCNNESSIDKLSNELLLEILIRLPNCKFAIRSKCVSKRWLNVISNNFFVSQFLRRLHNNVNNKSPLPFALISQYKDVDYVERILVHSKDNPLDFASSGFSFDFLPQLRNERGEPLPKMVSIWGTHRDLVLVSMVKNMRQEEYVLRQVILLWPREEVNHELDPGLEFLICNPRTKKWVALPHVPNHPIHPNYVALVCEPFYSFDNIDQGNRCLQYDSFRYRILCVPNGGHEVDVFISETRQWGKLLLSCPKGQGTLKLKPVLPPVVNNGMLYWVNESNIVAFDPFGVENGGGVVACRVIGLPSGVSSTSEPWKVGTCSGTLRLCRAELQPGYSHIIRVWDLIEDYDEYHHDKGTHWCSKHQFSSNDFKVFRNPSLKINLKDMNAKYNLCVLGVHPYDMDILYLLFGYNIVECNMKTRTLEATAEYHPRIRPAFTHGNQNIGYDMKNLYQVFLPWWPTPVPALQ